MLRPRSLYPSVQLTPELVGCSINAGTLPVTYVSGPDISILPNHRTFLICLDTGNVSSAGWTLGVARPAGRAHPAFTADIAIGITGSSPLMPCCARG